MNQQWARWGWALVVGLGAGWGASGAYALPELISVRLVDARGERVEGDFQVADSWRWEDGIPIPYSPMTPDGAHRFLDDVAVRTWPLVLMAYDEDGGRSGVAIIESPPAGDDVVIEIGRSVRVKSRFQCRVLGDRLDEVYAYWSLADNRALFMTTDDRRFDFRLPANPEGLPWESYIYSGLTDSVDRTLDLSDRKRVENLGTIKLEADFVGRNLGHRIDDWTVTAARGVSDDGLQIRDYRGRWVLVEFWGHW